jgi:hypothetical protein
MVELRMRDENIREQRAMNGIEMTGGHGESWGTGRYL